jgi:hypothetical protein
VKVNSPPRGEFLMRTTANPQIAPEFDFLAHLSEKLGADREAVKDALGQWLIHFEPSQGLAGATGPRSDTRPTHQ